MLEEKEERKLMLDPLHLQLALRLDLSLQLQHQHRPLHPFWPPQTTSSRLFSSSDSSFFLCGTTLSTPSTRAPSWPSTPPSSATAPAAPVSAGVASRSNRKQKPPSTVTRPARKRGRQPTSYRFFEAYRYPYSSLSTLAKRSNRRRRRFLLFFIPLLPASSPVGLLPPSDHKRLTLQHPQRIVYRSIGVYREALDAQSSYAEKLLTEEGWRRAAGPGRRR
jgi:hypothetical protein